MGSVMHGPTDTDLDSMDLMEVFQEAERKVMVGRL